MSNTTGRQRLFAAALGIKVTDRTDADRLSSQIDSEKQRRKEKPSKGQVRVASEWGVIVKPDDTFGRMLDRLWNAGLARVFVFSVARRTLAADWRSHDESRLPQTWVAQVASDLCADAERCTFVLDMDNSLSGTKGDAWFRFGKRQAESAAYRYVELRLISEQQYSPVSEGKRKAKRQVKQKPQNQGCLVMLTAVLFTVTAAVCLVSVL